MVLFSTTRIGPVLAGLLALAGPAFAEAVALREDAHALALPDKFDIPADPAVRPAPGKAWWTLFGDPELDGLIARAHTANTGIAQAAAHLALARSAAKAGTASQMPIAAIDGSATHAEGPLINAAGESGDLFTAKLSIGWEADLFSRLSGQRAAERQDVLAADALLQRTTLLIEAETARTWFIGRHFAEAAKQAHRICALLQEAQAIAAKREALGLAAPSAGEMLRRRLDAAQLRESELVLQRDAAWRQLGFLLGETKSVTPGDEAVNPQPPEVPVGLPADLMRRRPDINAAQAGLMAADERLRSERKGWLPSIGLTASGGAASASLGQLLSASASSFGLGILLALPVFDGGRHKARVAGRQAQRDGAAATYRETVLRALREVNDNLQTLQVRRAALDMAATAEREGYFLLSRSRQQLANGTQSRLGAIEFQVTALERKIIRSDATARALVASLHLMQALGGGWE